MKPKYFLRNDVLHEVHEVVKETSKTITIEGSMGTVTVRKNGKDGKLYHRRPFGWGNIWEKKRCFTPARLSSLEGRTQRKGINH